MSTSGPPAPVTGAPLAPRGGTTRNSPRGLLTVCVYLGSLRRWEAITRGVVPQFRVAVTGVDGLPTLDLFYGTDFEESCLEQARAAGSGDDEVRRVLEALNRAYEEREVPLYSAWWPKATPKVLVQVFRGDDVAEVRGGRGQPCRRGRPGLCRRHQRSPHPPPVLHRWSQGHWLT